MSYKRKKSARSGLIAGIISAAIAIAALIIIVNVIGSPSGKRVGQGGSSAGAQPTTQSVSTETTGETGKDKEKETKEKETTKKKEEETTTKPEETTTAKASDSGMNPKNYEEAIDTEREADKRVYLTFDDGPSVHTDEILDILKKYGIKATFFNTSSGNAQYKDAEKRAYEEGHTIGIHTVTHEYSEIYSSFDAWKADVLGEQEKIKENTGITTKYYRFPGGASNSMGSKYGTSISKCIEWLDENGYKFYDWNVDNQDADGQTYTADQLADNVIDSVVGSEVDDYIVLMHDAKPKKTTVQSLPRIIETLQAKGYTFCQITDNTKEIHHRLYEG